jgi:hypothetical protein
VCTKNSNDECAYEASKERGIGQPPMKGTQKRLYQGIANCHTRSCYKYPDFQHRTALYYMGPREVIPRKDLQLKGPPEDLKECPFCQDIVQQQTTAANGDNDNSDDDDTITADNGTLQRRPRTTRSRQTPEQPLVPLELYIFRSHHYRKTLPTSYKSLHFSTPGRL